MRLDISPCNLFFKDLCNFQASFIYLQIQLMQPVKLFKDPRHFQICFQSVFLFYGILFLHWSSPWWLYTTYFVTGIFTQFLCELIVIKNGIKRLSNTWWQKLYAGMPSALISSFGLALFLKTNNIFIAVFASSLAIVSKYVIRINGKHIFNPSALGIVASVMLTGQAWINPGQWGSGFILLVGILTLGVIVVTRVQKLDVSLAFLGTFASLLFIRQILYLNWPLDFFVQTISTGAVLVFSFFMISDPKTTPNHSTARILWAMLVGIGAFYLATFKYVNGAPVYVLVGAQLLVPLLDRIFKAGLFDWKMPKQTYKKVEVLTVRHPVTDRF
jgi:Na+-transporting NADH:ubiquinone oxidoreductase subunit NqrB